MQETLRGKFRWGEVQNLGAGCFWDKRTFKEKGNL